MNGTNRMNLAISRLATNLQQRYGAFIDLSDIEQIRSEKELEKDLLTRSLAAHVLSSLCRLEPEASASAVCDGFDDLGIDGFHYHREAKIAYVVQAKWSDSGNKQITEVESLKTIQGLRSILSLDFRHANARLTAFARDIDEAANDSEAKFCIVFATTSRNCMGPQAKAKTQDEVQRLAGFPELVFVEEFPLQRVYESITPSREPKSIDFQVEMEGWAQVRDPEIAYYGRVALKHVVEWQQYGTDLFHRNLRSFLADEELMASLEYTLANEPAHFWYFNNGATLLCSRVRKLAKFGDSQSLGVFECEGASVVNGAQTIGIIWKYWTNSGMLDPDARLPLRLISLESATPEFPTKLTRALNTQKRIDSRDFVALDPLQHRIRREMALDGRVYVFRVGDAPIDSKTEYCDFESAAVALACADGDIDLATQAKRYVSSLWNSTAQPPYTTIFPNNIDASTVWKAVEISRAVTRVIDSMKMSSAGRQRTVLSHGNRFILYRVFKHPIIRRFRADAESLEDLLVLAAESAQENAQCVCSIMQNQWRAETVQYLFKYASKCRDLDVLCDREMQTEHTFEGGQKTLFDDLDGDVV